MRQPIKPRKPTKPRQPKEFHIKLEHGGYFDRTNTNNPISLSELVKQIKTLYAEKKNLNPKSVKLSDISLFEMYGSWGWIVKEPNFDFPKQNESYLKHVSEYAKKLVEYEESLKKYEIDLKIYNAWLLKKREDEIEDELKNLEKQLEAVRREKKGLLEITEDENEKACLTTKTKTS